MEGRIKGMTLVDAYYISDEFVSVYRHNREVCAAAALRTMRGWCRAVRRDWAGSEDGEAVLGLDEGNNLVSLVHLDPDGVQGLLAALGEGSLEGYLREGKLDELEPPKVVAGDLLELMSEGRFDVVVHGCNAFCTMDVGIARQFRECFPEVLEVDLATSVGDRNKLGTYTSVQVSREGCSVVVVNAYTQYEYDSPDGGDLVDYEAAERAFRAIAADFPGARIGYPMIGAGAAGGNFERLEKILYEAFEGCVQTLVVKPVVVKAMF